MLSVLFLLSVSSISQSAISRYESRIINGKDVAPGEIPYQVSLQTKRSSHICGGSILNEYYVITAAHCVENKIPADLVIIADTVNLNRPGPQHAIKQIISHEKYDPHNSWLNDIALLKMFSPFRPSRNIGFVTLPEQDEAIQEGIMARVSGFGITKNGLRSKILQQATIYITSQEYCKDMYNKVLSDIYDTQICANDPNKRRGACKSDSGGPLIVNGKLVGIVSWAKGCALTEYPTVYTRVSLYIDWIEKNIV
ncbi:mite allergen Der p 3-like [Camponotus floridanus]|uniref:mite allergen Der p 3-like n=1 Tax=Camponotus floridanus TaxID=104421 RepID=UPI0009716FC1|nr:mite allergen Der p 3-like [Camponotus floridanus]